MVPEKAMAPHSSTLAWNIPWMEEPGGIQSMGSRRVGHDWVTSLSLFTFMHWRRQWQPTPMILPGESQGRGSLVGCRLWDGRVGHDWSHLAAAAAAAVSGIWFLRQELSSTLWMAASFATVLNGSCDLTCVYLGFRWTTHWMTLNWSSCSR